MARRDKINYYLDIADAVSRRGTCLRRNYGAIIVKNDEILSTGYVGAPRGRKNCSDMAVSYTHLMAPLEICALVWAAVAAALVLGSLISLLRLRRSLRGAVQVGPGLSEAAGLPTAFVLGVVHPRIYLPAGLPIREREHVCLLYTSRCV